jgi:RNA processing factor Prp31
MKKHNLFDQHNSKKWSVGINIVTRPEGLHPGTLPIEYRSYIDDCDKEIEEFPDNNKEQLKIHFENLRQIIGSKRSNFDKQSVINFFEEQSEIKKKDYYKIFPLIEKITK